MADLSTPSAAIMTTMDATEPVTSVTGGKSPIKDDSITKTAKAEKPDEEIYKKNLEAAEAELKAVQQKQVCFLIVDLGHSMMLRYFLSI